MAKTTIDCTPSDDGFMAMANVMLESIFNGCIKKNEKERAGELLGGILEIYRYLYTQGYHYENDHIVKNGD